MPSPGRSHDTYILKGFPNRYRLTLPLEIHACVFYIHIYIYTLWQTFLRTVHVGRGPIHLQKQFSLNKAVGK